MCRARCKPRGFWLAVGWVNREVEEEPLPWSGPGVRYVTLREVDSEGDNDDATVRAAILLSKTGKLRSISQLLHVLMHMAFLILLFETL